MCGLVIFFNSLPVILENLTIRYSSQLILRHIGENDYAPYLQLTPHHTGEFHYALYFHLTLRHIGKNDCAVSSHIGDFEYAPILMAFLGVVREK